MHDTQKLVPAQNLAATNRADRRQLDLRALTHHFCYPTRPVAS